METSVFIAVILAAFLHAAWNVQIKLNLDRFLALFLMQGFCLLFGLAMLAVFGLPDAPGWPYALVSGFLHTGYNLFLARSYRHGDLSLVYPIARGSAPLFTLIITVLAFAQVPSTGTLAGILVLIGGLMLAGLSGRSGKGWDRTSLFFALGTAVFIALYTVVDGMGGRVSGNPLAYSGLAFVIDGLFMVIVGWVWRGHGIFRDVAPLWRSGALASAASVVAYTLVIWAMAHAPIPAVAALRETSVFFALLMSARFLKESLTWQRVAGAVLIVLGAVLLRLA